MVNLYNGDCLEIMKNIADESVDAILCDLPYGTTNCKWDIIIDFDKMWEQINRVMKKNGAVLLFGNNPFSALLISSNIKNYKYDWVIEYEEDIVIEKTHATGHLNAKKMPMKAHEYIHVFYKRFPTYLPIKTTGHERKTAVKRNDETEVYGKQSGTQSYDSTERYPRSVLKFAWDKQKSAVHPTQKPVSLCEYMIKTYSNEGDVILDFTMGSGTTGVACVNTNRNFIGIEMDQKHYNTAVERINNAKL